ncbi:guanine nucleotide exchange factor DBS-like isoform X2 [Watersipora subatra]|uniref:guanine nucleotide exchange factor DBS-like isoform X2 n=1 Tax=Watersipora subatra TaxID=2589382 RepID=UPI00355BCDA0
MAAIPRKDNSKDITINDIASAFHSGFFLVTGSTSLDGCPIVISLDGVHPEPDEELQKNSLIYIGSLPTPRRNKRFSTDKDLHYCFIIDRRKSTWTCIRKLLTVILTSFVRPIKEVILLQPTGFFQKRYSASESVKLQADFPSFQVVVLDDSEALVKKFGTDNLCEQLGGSIEYNISNYIQQRMSIDSLQSNCLDLEERVKDLLLEDAQTDYDIPNDVASTEALLNEHAENKTNISDEIMNIKSQGEVVLQCFRDKVENLPAAQQVLHIQEVQKLTTRLEDLHEAITDYWEKEEHKLQEFMKLREFHEEFKSLQQNLNKLAEALSNVKDFVSCVKEALANTKRLTKIATDSQSLLGRSKWISQVWSSKITSTDGLTIDTVGPKCEELIRLHDLCIGLLKSKQDLASCQASLYTQTEAAEQWLSDELEHPLREEVRSEDSVSISSDRKSSESSISSQLKRIDFQLTIGKFLEILNFDEFMKTYKSALSENSKVHVEELRRKVMELMGKYELRRGLLVEELAKLTQPFKNPNKVMKRRKSSFAFFGREKAPAASGEGETSPDAVFLESNEMSQQQEKSRRISSRLAKSDGQGSLNSETSSTASSEEKTGVSYGSSLSASFSPVSPTNSSISRGSSYRGSESKGKASTSNGGVELASEASDRFNLMARQINDLTNDGNGDLHKSLGSKGRRGSMKAIKGMFSRKKSKQMNQEDAKSENSLVINGGVFEKSLTMEEEALLSQARSLLIESLVTSEKKYVNDLRHIVEFYMQPIVEAGESVPTELYANQSLIFSNLEEIYQFNSKIFLPELCDSKDSPSLVAAIFKNQMLSKYKDFCTSRSRAEVLLRQLADDEFLAEKVRQQGHEATLSSLLLLPARRIVQYQTFLQGMHNNLKDDLEVQRDISLVLSLLADTINTAGNLLHQVTIDGYHEFMAYLTEVDLLSHGSLLHQGRVLVAHDKKSQHTKPSDFKSKLKPRHAFLYEKCLLFCRIHEDNDRLRPYSYLHAIKLADSSLEQGLSETSHKFVFRCGNESYLIECEPSDQASWYENLHFALHNCETAKEDLSPRRKSSPNIVPNVTITKPRTFMDEDEDIRLGEAPDLNILDLDDLDLTENFSQAHNSSGAKHEINGNSLKQYILNDDFDNDLLVGKGDIVECVTIRKDMMQVQLPGTGIKSWFPLDLLVPQD